MPYPCEWTDKFYLSLQSVSPIFSTSTSASKEPAMGSLVCGKLGDPNPPALPTGAKDSRSLLLSGWIDPGSLLLLFSENLCKSTLGVGGGGKKMQRTKREQMSENEWRGKQVSEVVPSSLEMLGSSQSAQSAPNSWGSNMELLLSGYHISKLKHRELLCPYTCSAWPEPHACDQLSPSQASPDFSTYPLAHRIPNNSGSAAPANQVVSIFLFLVLYSI